MTLSIITAMDKNGLIGKGKELPWHLSADLAHFKETTMGHPVIMGKKTFEGIGKPLPGRTNIVLTHSGINYDGVVTAASLEEALVAAKDDEVFVIGGATVYAKALPDADRLYITFVDGAFDGDVYFPDIDWTQWKEIERVKREKDEKNPNDLVFGIFERIRE